MPFSNMLMAAGCRRYHSVFPDGYSRDKPERHEAGCVVLLQQEESSQTNNEGSTLSLIRRSSFTADGLERSVHRR